MIKLSWKTEKRLIKDLMLSDINPRKISPEQKEALSKSLQKFNLADIPVLNTDNTIISGNQRLQILYELGKGDEKIDVRVPNRKLNEEELKEYMLIANTHAGVFDAELLEVHFENVKIDFEIPLEFEQEKESRNINLLNNTDLDQDIEKFKAGIRKAIQIEFEPQDYEEAQQLVKYCRDNHLYIGKFLIDKLKQEKKANETN